MKCDLYRIKQPSFIVHQFYSVLHLFAGADRGVYERGGVEQEKTERVVSSGTIYSKPKKTEARKGVRAPGAPVRGPRPGL